MEEESSVKGRFKLGTIHGHLATCARAIHDLASAHQHASDAWEILSVLSPNEVLNVHDSIFSNPMALMAGPWCAASWYCVLPYGGISYNPNPNPNSNPNHKT